MSTYYLSAEGIIGFQGHGAEVPAVAWSPQDLGRVVTTSDDCSLMVWRLQRGITDFNKNMDSNLGTVVGTAQRMCREVGEFVCILSRFAFGT